MFDHVSDFSHATEWLALWIGQVPVVVDTPNAMNVAAHRYDEISAVNDALLY